MHKLILALTATAIAAAALPANAQPLAQSSLKGANNQCFKSTDSSRGFGYWTSCEHVYVFSVTRPQRTLTVLDNDRGSDGGGGDGGGGGGGGGNR